MRMLWLLLVMFVEISSTLFPKDSEIGVSSQRFQSVKIVLKPDQQVEQRLRKAQAYMRIGTARFLLLYRVRKIVNRARSPDSGYPNASTPVSETGSNQDVTGKLSRPARAQEQVLLGELSKE